MDITHELLLSLGFIQDPSRYRYYTYKGITGSLCPDSGQFFFHGFTRGITTLTELKYQLELIDHKA